MKLRTQIVLVLALGTLLPLFATGYFFYRISVTRLNERADIVLQSLTRRIGSDIDGFVNRATESSRTDGMMAPLVDYVQASPDVREGRVRTISELLRTTATHDPVNIASCALFDREGRLLLDTASTTIDRSEADRPWIRLPLTNGLPIIVPELADPVFRGLWVSSPIRDSSGAIVGVIRHRYQIAVLQQLVSSISEFTDGAVYAEIVDQNGTVLADGGHPGRVGNNGRLAALMSPPGAARVEPRLKIDWDPATPGPGPRGRLSTSRLQQAPWTVRVHVSAPFYNLATNELRRVAFMLGGLVILLIGVSAVFVSTRISRPLAQLARAVEHMQSGPATAELPNTGPVEVGLLAGAFNALSRQLRQALATLERSVADVRRSEQQQRALIDAMPVAIVLLGADRSIRYLNRQFVTWSGYTATDLPALDQWWEPAGPGIGDTERQALRATLLSDPSRALHGEADIICRDGARRHVESRSTLLGDETLVVLTDLTERRRAEFILRASEERFRLLVENSAELVVQVSGDSRIRYASPNHFAITGRPAAELLGTSILAHVHPADLRRIAAQFRRRNATGLFRYRFADGSWHWVESSGRSFATSTGEELGVIVTRDVTARVQAEENGRRLEEQLRQAQKIEAIGTLAGGIAHDFNNILAGIMGNTQLAALTLPVDHPTRPLLDEALRASLRARDLVAQILTFSRRRELQLSPANLRPVIQEALQLLRASLPSSVIIQQDLAEDLPLVLCDPSQIHQIVMNLGTNAAHALGPHGGNLALALATVHLTPAELQSNPQLKPAHTVRLTVRDNGCGMDAATLARIFEPFFTTKPVGKGTGLGLAVVHGIVQSLEGAITVESEPGRGTTVQVYLAGMTNTLPTAPAAPTGPTRGRGEHIALVDDEPAIIRVTSRALGSLGYTCTSFSDPGTALAALAAAPDTFAALITDLTMPGLSGIELASAVHETIPALPIILISGNTRDLDPAVARIAGVTAVIEKPFTLESFAATVAQVLPPAKPPVG